MKKTIAMLLTAAVSASLLAGCGSSSKDQTTAQASSEAASKETAGNQETSTKPSYEKETADSQPDGGVSYTIGIGQFAEHGSLDNCREGFLEGLAEAGIEEGKNLTVLYENSQADGGTPVGEITGTSDKLPVEQQLQMIREILPDAKRIGIMYTTSEVNSESAIAEYKALAPGYGFEIVDTGISSSADISLAADTLISKVDCITNLTDNTVVASLPVILDKAASKNIPVFGSEIEQVKIGCLAAMGLDYIELGKQTGHMAAQVLKGEKKASEMNYETIKEAAFYGNSKVAENLGITLPESLTADAADIFTEIAQ